MGSKAAKFLKKNQNVTLHLGTDGCLKKNQNAPRPSEHPPVTGKKVSKRLGGIKGCKYKTSSWHLNRFPDNRMQITSGQQYNVGEKPTVILHIYINRHVGTPGKH